MKTKLVHMIQHCCWGVILTAFIAIFLIVGGLENFRIDLLPGVIGLVICLGVALSAYAAGCWADRQ
jgi:hypothetical protein